MMADTQRNRKKSTDLGLRLVSALILGPFVLLITYLGGIAYALLVGLVGGALLLPSSAEACSMRLAVSANESPLNSSGKGFAC